MRAGSVVLSTLGLISIGLTACQMPEASRDAVERRSREAQAAAFEAGSPASIQKAGTVAIHDGIWVGGRSIPRANGDALPPAAEASAAVVLNSMGVPLELREIAAEITTQTGLQVALEERLDAPTTVSAGTGGQAALGALPTIGAAHAPTGMTLAWNGPLSGLLDGVATFFGLQWEYRGGQIRLFRHEVRTFTLAALPSTSIVRSGVNTTGGGAATASTGSGNVASTGSMLQDTANETTIKLWDDVKETIQAMLPPGAKVAMSPATGTVTVIAPPLTMRRVADYIQQQNARITRQVTISVKVLRVEVNDSYDLGLDLGVVFQQLAGQYAFNLSGPAPLTVTSGTAASYLVQALQNPTSNKGHWATGTNPANATRAVIDALQTMGRVTLMTETSVTTLNGRAAPVSVAEQQSYVASTATTLASGVSGTTQTQITPATLITGFNMQVLPRVLDDGEVLLQYGLSLSDLKELKLFSSNGTQVQLPDVNLRSFLQEALMRSGDLLVLAGYQSAADNLANTGLPDIGPSIFGGSIQTVRSKSVIVIMMTPQVLTRSAEATR